jgi:hypothetical protein
MFLSLSDAHPKMSDHQGTGRKTQASCWASSTSSDEDEDEAEALLKNKLSIHLLLIPSG